MIKETYELENLELELIDINKNPKTLDAYRETCYYINCIREILFKNEKINTNGCRRGVIMS